MSGPYLSSQSDGSSWVSLSDNNSAVCFAWQTPTFGVVVIQLTHSTATSHLVLGYLKHWRSNHSNPGERLGGVLLFSDIRALILPSQLAESRPAAKWSHLYLQIKTFVNISIIRLDYWWTVCSYASINLSSNRLNFWLSEKLRNVSSIKAAFWWKSWITFICLSLWHCEHPLERMNAQIPWCFGWHDGATKSLTVFFGKATFSTMHKDSYHVNLAICS